MRWTLATPESLSAKIFYPNRLATHLPGVLLNLKVAVGTTDRTDGSESEGFATDTFRVSNSATHCRGNLLLYPCYHTLHLVMLNV